MAAKNASFQQLVVVGSSAGGIEALRTLVETLPPDFPAPIVLAQHLDPTHPSRLVEILTPRSVLPVRSLTDREVLEPGIVFVVPSDFNVEITDHDIRLLADGERRPHPSVDLLLSSAAMTFGENLIAVILTGSGSDGAAGAAAVKRAGGLVIIQDPETATFPSMPLSLAPTTVDIVAGLESIGQILSDVVRGDFAGKPPTEDEQLMAFMTHLREQSGVDFTNYKPATIRRRLQRRFLATNTRDLRAYNDYLRQHPEEYASLINGFLINVTEFFRDPALYDYLRDHILPSLVAEAKERGELRLWSAGCATGEEAYSLAILVAELLGAGTDHLDVRIFATDLDGASIAFARRGVYPASSLAALPDNLRDRYFDQLDDSCEARKQIRNMIVFGQHDLVQRAPFPRIDLVFCRNVLIYFMPELQQRALQLFASSLREGGYLVLGKTENVSQRTAWFAPDQTALKIFRRTADHVGFPARRLHDGVLPPIVRAPPRTQQLVYGRGAAIAQRESEKTRGRAGFSRFETALLNLPFGIVIVNRSYDIQIINGAARRMFGIHASAVNEDFLHLVQYVPLDRMRQAIDAAFKGESPHDVHEVTAIYGEPEQRRFIEVSCYAEQSGSADRSGAVIILTRDVSETEGNRRQLAETIAGQQAANETLLDQLRAHTETNRQLLDANQDLIAHTAELQSANEELTISNEEAQAAAEEVETLNEELQATNEELETLNEELQSTNEELNVANDDLASRSDELRTMASSLDEQRRRAEDDRDRLSAIVTNMADPVIVVARDGSPVLANEAYREILGDLDAGFEPLDERGQPFPPELAPQQRAARGELFSQDFTLTAPNGERRWFEARGNAIMRDGRHEGGVITIRDITDRSLRQLQDEFMALAGHELRTPLATMSGYLQLLRRQLAKQ